MKTLIFNACIVNEGRKFNGYVVIDDEFIHEVGEGMPAEVAEDTTKIDAEGALLLPGVIDTHVHFREPGLTHKASIATESAAAVAGGVTSFLDMPNTAPAATTVEVVDLKKSIAAETSLANYGFFIGATNSNIDQLLAADYTSIPGVKLFMGSSTGNMLVDRREALDRLFSEFKGVIAVHAEDEATIAENREKIINQYGEDAPVAMHSQFRSREACMRSSQLAVEIARKYDSRLHILHISTADELSMLASGPLEGKRITAETCPHYLIFTAEDLNAERGYLRKCNPAIKDATDRKALAEALASDLIDVVATDHAPHLFADKQGSLFKAASGMPGVKFSLPLMLDMTLQSGALTVEQVVEKMAHNPAQLYGIDHRGFIRSGYYADLVLVAQTESKKITDADVNSHVGSADAQQLASPCDWTPYSGLHLSHRVLTTFVNGRVAFDGQYVIPANRNARALQFNAK